jgi:signal transduction histidine kinase
MLAYSRNILLLSLVISLITATLVYGALRYHIVRPMRRLTANIIGFSAQPESAASAITPSGRRDEIGIAEARLAEMQKSLRDLLAQRRHLADLGLAVSKINHDLRNILASAQLFSDRMGTVEDPLAKRFAPKVIRAIDRAIGYTRAVLAYGQASEEPPRRQLVALARLVDDVADVLALSGQERVHWANRVASEIEVDADPEQLFRVLLNLCRNAMEAVGESEEAAVIRRVWVEAERQGGVVRVRVCDTGPGVPPKARENLFLPFQGSARRGGTGLGLAIAAEIVRAHGGEIALVERAGAGAIFELTIPDRPVDLEARRQIRQS